MQSKGYHHKDTKTQRAPIEPISAEAEAAAKAVANAAFAVHLTLGPGLLESVYELYLARELELRGVKFRRQVVLPVQYADMQVEAGFRIDIVVNDCLIVELKAVEQLLPVHTEQLLTYLKLSGDRLGLLLNFNVPLIRQGIKRIAL